MTPFQQELLAPRSRERHSRCNDWTKKPLLHLYTLRDQTNSSHAGSVPRHYYVSCKNRFVTQYYRVRCNQKCLKSVPFHTQIHTNTHARARARKQKRRPMKARLHAVVSCFPGQDIDSTKAMVQAKTNKNKCGRVRHRTLISRCPLVETIGSTNLHRR